MLSIKRTLPEDFKTLEIRNIADAHIGDAFCDMKLLQKDLDYIKDHDNCFCVVNGDLLNTATKQSISDSYAEKMMPQKQIEKAEELLTPIKDKILTITRGNHEKRIYRESGIDISKITAHNLGLDSIYSPAMSVIFLRFGKDESRENHHRPVCYVIACNHGSGGGRKEGAKAIRLADMAAIIDADIYIHSHTHLPMVFPESFYRMDMTNNSVKAIDHLFVNTGSYLDYGGYGEEGEFKPNTKRNPRILLSGTVKHAEAIV